MKQCMVVAFLGLIAVTALASPIVQYLNGSFSYASFFYPGESFTTPGGGPWTDVSFNFYANIPPTTPLAAGTAFLLSTVYTGTPAALSSSTPGFIASSISNAGGIYSFDSSVVLQPNTQYWVFTNTAGFRFSGSTTDGTSSQSLYTTNAATGNFTNQPNPNNIANFTFSGGNILTLPGGSPSAPVFLLSTSGVAQVTGSIAGEGSQDYYSFFWPGGAFSATASITGANAGASYLFSEGTVGSCSNGSSLTLNSSDSFSGTISFASLAPGQYCIGLDANNPNDPFFTLTFSTPVDTAPEPSSLVLLGVGLASWIGLRRRTNLKMLGVTLGKRGSTNDQQLKGTRNRAFHTTR
jgi:hypothetical protein